MSTYPAHTGNHALPISNGYGGGWMGVPISVYCGRCDGTYRPDVEWATRYFAARRRKVEQDARLGPGARADALAELDRRESEALASLAP